MAVPDPQIGGGGGGGIGAGHLDPEITTKGAISKTKNFSALWASVWSKNKWEGSGPAGSATYTLRMHAATSPRQWQPYTVVQELVGSLSIDDGDGNENGEKQ